MPRSVSPIFGLLFSGALLQFTAIAATVPPQAPYPVSVSPAAGSGPVQVMTFSFFDSRGVQDLDILNILINNALDGSRACYLAYSPAQSMLFLVNDSGSAL